MVASAVFGGQFRLQPRKHCTMTSLSTVLVTEVLKIKSTSIHSVYQRLYLNLFLSEMFFATVKKLFHKMFLGK